MVLKYISESCVYVEILDKALYPLKTPQICVALHPSEILRPKSETCGNSTHDFFLIIPAANSIFLINDLSHVPVPVLYWRKFYNWLPVFLEKSANYWYEPKLNYSLPAFFLFLLLPLNRVVGQNWNFLKIIYLVFMSFESP